jgi:hypothetical protein
MRGLSILFAGTVAAAGLAGCVLKPTESHQVVDQRAQISFRFDAVRAEARVQVDGLDSGRLGDYEDGKGALRIQAGTHVVRVVDGGQTLLEERAFLADGVARAFAVR